MNKTNTNSNESKDLHETLRQIPYNLFAVGVGQVHEDKNAFVGSWVTQCSFEPPMLAIGVHRDTTSYELINTYGTFTINLLSKDQQEIARKLVKPAHRVGDKLDDLSHRAGTTGTPVLDQCLGFVECRVVSKMNTGEHALIVGEAVHAEQHSDEEPLACADIGWHYAG